jgi:hypothetical protein
LLTLLSNRACTEKGVPQGPQGKDQAPDHDPADAELAHEPTGDEPAEAGGESEELPPSERFGQNGRKLNPEIAGVGTEALKAAFPEQAGGDETLVPGGERGGDSRYVGRLGACHLRRG